MAARRTTSVFLTVALIAAGLAGILAGPATSAPKGPDARDAGILGTAVRGTGVLPNFEASGSGLIRLLAGSFDPLAGPLPRPAGIALADERALPASTAQYWLTQVRDLRFHEVTEAVEVAGGRVVGIVPDDTYMVRATPAQRDSIAASPAVRWMGYYQPAWRVPVAAAGKPALMSLKGERTLRVHAFRDDPDPGSVGRALAGMAGVKVLSDAVVAVDVRTTVARVPAIAAIPAVEWVGVKPKPVALNAQARWVNDTGVRDLYAATAPGRLTGAGQTAAVADTGLNYKPDLNGRAHIGFRDCDGAGVCKEAIYTQVTPGSSESNLLNTKNNATGHRKMAAYFDIGDTGPNMYDESSHGSHTGGSVSGDQPPYGAFTGEDGLAPGAMHVHQNIADASGGLVLPDDDYQLWRQAYRPRNPSGVSESSGANGNPADYSTNYLPLEDARTHNNSYGLLVDLVDEGSAMALDRFVWDHEDMVIVVSAGNGGPGPGTIGSPSVAKNDLSSGASANGRQPMASIDSMASFSSHGPTGDGRLGVDLATPGQVVVSVKGGSEFDYHTAQGTSMSAPVLTGLATLVRQYFWDGYGPAGATGFAVGEPSLARRHNPSAALVKATLVNGAERMKGYYTGADGTDRSLDGQWPSEGQGYGQVNLDNSLYFANDPVNNFYGDVYRNDPKAFSISPLRQARAFKVRVDSGAPFDITLAWTDAPNLLPAGTPSLVNDLNLRLVAPDGTLYKGNQIDSRLDPTIEEASAIPLAQPTDVRNTVERVRIADPQPGIWTVNIVARPIAMGNQGFAVAASGGISRPSGIFTPGPELQVDAAGNPAISNVQIVPAGSDTAKVTFDTNEPTTATATLTDDGNTVTFIDSFNLSQAGLPGAPAGDDGYYGIDEGTVETSPEFANKPAVGTSHEILLTGLNPDGTYSITLAADDLGSNQATQVVAYESPNRTYQSAPADTAQLISDGTTQWKTGTQMYTGEAGGNGYLGAFGFRVPPGSVDLSTVTAASVELTSSHNWVPVYTDDPELSVDLLHQAVEPGWGTHDYQTVHDAEADARAFPETTHKIGAYQRYAFTFRCGDLQALKDTLADGVATFRWDTANLEEVSDALFAIEFGFNRRSRGADLRPRLVLFTGDANPYEEPCDPGTPPPTISDVGIHPGTTSNSMTVSWRTDVRSDSMVLFREQGATDWIQVATPARSTLVHHVQVFGLDSTKHYEFAVRSAACNGATTTDANGGEGYDFFGTVGPPPDPGPRTEHASYSFEAGAEGWTVTTTTSPTPPSTSWERRSPGADGTTMGWHASPYTDQDETSLISPSVAVSGAQVGVEFFVAHDTEDTFDFLHVEYSADGTTWHRAASFDGQSSGYPAYVPRDVRFNHPNPGGALQVRFRFVSDLLISAPEYLGVSVDEVTLASYPNAIPVGDDPLTGPVPPPSAGASGLAVPATRTGAANAADLAAGTGACSIPA